MRRLRKHVGSTVGIRPDDKRTPEVAITVTQAGLASREYHPNEVDHR
jgi:hypothetical protein